MKNLKYVEELCPHFQSQKQVCQTIVNLPKCTSCTYWILPCFHQILPRQQLASSTRNCKGQKSRSSLVWVNTKFHLWCPKQPCWWCYPETLHSWSNCECNSELLQRENSSLARETSNQKVMLYKNNQIWSQWKPDQSFARKRTIQWNFHRYIKASTCTISEPMIVALGHTCTFQYMKLWICYETKCSPFVINLGDQLVFNTKVLRNIRQHFAGGIKIHEDMCNLMGEMQPSLKVTK